MKHGLCVRCLTFWCDYNCMLIFLAKTISQHVSCNKFHLVAHSPRLHLIWFFNELTKRGGNWQYEVSNKGEISCCLIKNFKIEKKDSFHDSYLVSLSWLIRIFRSVWELPRLFNTTLLRRNTFPAFDIFKLLFKKIFFKG